ncbi:hypothetical protein [Spirosoma fluminis]
MCTLPLVCVIPLQGTLSRYGLCSWGYEDLAGIIEVANQLDSVQAIVLKIDSPGGAVNGQAAEILVED